MDNPSTPVAIAMFIIVVCALWWGFRSLRAPRLMSEEDIPLGELQKIIDNERILKGRGGGLSTEEAKKLHEHPTIKCRWNDDSRHGRPRRAVYQRDMRYPVCRSCLVEDPAE